MKDSLNLKHWIFGFVFSILAIWCLSFLFGDTLGLHKWSSEVGAWIRPPGSIQKMRSEGWGTSSFGQFDIIGVEDISNIKVPTIAIWGDSHVEAFQVEQEKKMQEQLMDMWRADGLMSLRSIGIGMSGQSVADYYFKIPLYEKICPSIFAHFIVISSLGDVLPNQSSANHASFQSKPNCRIIEGHKVPANWKIKALFRKFGLDFLWQPVKSLLKDTKFQFSVGPRTKIVTLKDTEIIYKTRNEKAFIFLLNALKQQTTMPIIFIYCPPNIPAILDGKVNFKDDESEAVSVFARACRNNGISFINMTSSFSNYYRETGDFPRGFPNSRPSKGHFNDGGHRLIAKAIYMFLAMNRNFDVFYTN